MPDNSCIKQSNAALCNAFVPCSAVCGRQKYLLILPIAPTTDLSYSARKVTIWGGILEHQESAKRRDQMIRLKPK